MSYIGRGEEAVTSEVYWSLNGGSWLTIGTVNFTAAKLDTDSNRTLQETFSATVPNMPGGTVCFRARIDTGNDVRESNEGDNASRDECYAVALTLPDVDIVMNSVSVTNTPIAAGGLMGARVCMTNIGTAMPQTDASRANYSVLINGTWLEIAWDQVKSTELLPGVVHCEEILRLVPAPAIAGKYTLRACADANNQILEIRKDNNCSEVPFDVLAIGPDLTVIDLYLKVGSAVIREGGTVKKGSIVHPYCVWRNQGNAAAPAGMRLRYEISIGNVRDSDGVDQSQMTSGATGTEYVSNDAINLGQTGNRTYRCRVDYDNALPDLDRSNNYKDMHFAVK